MNKNTEKDKTKHTKTQFLLTEKIVMYREYILETEADKETIIDLLKSTHPNDVLETLEETDTLEPYNNRTTRLFELRTQDESGDWRIEPEK